MKFNSLFWLGLPETLNTIEWTSQNIGLLLYQTETSQWIHSMFHLLHIHWLPHILNLILLFLYYNPVVFAPTLQFNDSGLTSGIHSHDLAYVCCKRVSPVVVVSFGNLTIWWVENLEFERGLAVATNYVLNSLFTLRTQRNRRSSVNFHQCTD